MSQSGLQRTQQLLQVIGTQLPSIAQASEVPGLNLSQFIQGAIARSGVQFHQDALPLITALTHLIGPPEVMPAPVQPPLVQPDAG